MPGFVKGILSRRDLFRRGGAVGPASALLGRRISAAPVTAAGAGKLALSRCTALRSRTLHRQAEWGVDVGALNMGEYLNASWTAKRHSFGRARW